MGKLEKHSRERTQLIMNAKREGAKKSLEVFNHIVHSQSEHDVKRLWGSYHNLSLYLDGIDLGEY